MEAHHISFRLDDSQPSTGPPIVVDRGGRSSWLRVPSRQRFYEEATVVLSDFGRCELYIQRYVD
jgi:hypothetical protein